MDVRSTPSRADFPVWAGGRLYPRGSTVVSAEDEGFLLGLSVFDSLLLEDGCLFFLEQHLARLRRGAGELGIQWPPRFDPKKAVWALADAVDRRDCILRITLTRGVPGKGSSLFVTARALDPPDPKGPIVFVSSYRKLAGNALEGVKSTNRLRNVLAREEAHERGAWEALLLNHEGDLSEGTISNLFVASRGVLATPSSERGCLSGIVREELLNTLRRASLTLADGRQLALEVRRVELRDLELADEAFLTNSSGRVLGILEVRGLAAGPIRLPGARGAIALAARERMARIEDAYRKEHVQPAPGS